ncbi:AMP-binding enzyme [Microbulbifer taiwanensis]
MFISGGENVYPAEVEAAILQLPAVAEAAVVGVPDTTWGESGVAFVVAAGAQISEEEIRSHCREKLARYKVPRDFIVVDRIPRTGSGKALKSQLIELARALGLGG